MAHRDDQLTARERDVATLAVQGLTWEEIGESLFLSSNTVKTHLEHIYRKLGVHNRVGLAKVLAAPAGRS